MRVRICANRFAAILIALLGSHVAARAEGLRYDWRIEDGVEYDSNPARAERIGEAADVAAPGGSALARVTASGSAAARLGPTQALTLSGAFGGKWFTETDARAENVLVAQSAASYGLALGQRTRLSAALSYYDVFQRRSIDLPDFRSLAPGLRLDESIAESFVLSLAGGYRWFTFKPDRAYSFGAPTASVTLRQLLPGDLLAGDADWEWSVGASVEARAFQGPACAVDGCTTAQGATRHRDRFWIAHAELSRTGTWLWGTGVAVHLNQSNSYGESLARGLLHLRAVIPLPAQLSLSARGELVVTRYRDPLTFLQPVSGLPSASIEDESRSTVRVELARLFEGRFEVGARYVFYTNAPTSSAVEYRRQTLLLYMAFLDERQ
jgi:hypothetical protein